MNLGEKIYQMRKASGISQEQLAEQLDVSRQAVSKWELNDAMPDIGKIVMISELFSVSIDTLLKDSSDDGNEDREENSAGMEGNHKTPHKASRKASIEEIAKFNLASKQITLGFRTLIISLIMLVLEFMFLPVFGTMQKAHVQGQGFYSEFIKYASVQPMPAIFFITAIVSLAGITFMLKGFLYKRKTSIE